MQTVARKYLLFITKPYSVPILEPIQKAVEESDEGRISWFSASTARGLQVPGNQLHSAEEVLEFSPDAVIVPGNVVPHFWPGLKVQVFHGLDEETKGFYRITGFFDLYCTPGPLTTRRFGVLSKRYRTFMVSQTGWPKLDSLANRVDRQFKKRELGMNPEQPVILYAPTFPPKYTSAGALLSTITQLKKGTYHWLVKFHVLMDKEIQQRYRKLTGDNFRVVDDLNILPYMQAADLLITDTSSVAYEFLLLDRPLITFRAAARKDKGINLDRAGDLGTAIQRCLSNPDEFSEQRQTYLKELHPYSDGKSSLRVVKSIETVLKNNSHLELKRKPMNLVRKRQIQKLVSY